VNENEQQWRDSNRTARTNTLESRITMHPNIYWKIHTYILYIHKNIHTYKQTNIHIYVIYVQSTAHQTIQNCQTAPVDYQPYLLQHKAQISLGIFDSTNLLCCCPYHIRFISDIDISDIPLS
jgi:hypothetical protein